MTLLHNWLNSIGLIAIATYCARDYQRRRAANRRTLTVHDVNDMLKGSGLGPIPTRSTKRTTRLPRVR